jgi:hypothetical protein
MTKFKILILTIFGLTLHSIGWSQEITSVKGSKVYVESESPLEVGTQLDVIGSDGRSGTIEIVKVKGPKALAKVVDGQAKAGNKLKERKGESVKAESKKKGGLGKRFRMGLMGGVAMPSQTIKLTDVTLGNETITPTGSSYNIGAAFDLTLSRLLSVRLILAMDKFVTSTTSVKGLCNRRTSTSCTSNITFLLLEPWGKINLIKNSKFGLFLGVGGQLMVPLSVTTTTLNPDYVQTSFAMAPGFGADITLGSIVVPIQIDYAFLPSTEDLKTNILRIRTGFMF